MFALVLVPAVLSALPQSPSLANEDTGETPESPIKYSIKKENRNILSYKTMKDLTLDIISRSPITYSYYSTQWTVVYTATVTTTLTWWVVNQETDVVTPSDSNAVLRIGILGGIAFGITAFLAIMNAVTCCCGHTPHFSDSPRAPETPQTTPDMTPDEMEAMAIQAGGLAPAQPYTPVASPLAPIPADVQGPVTDAYPVPPDARPSANPYAPPPPNPYNVQPDGVPPPPVDADPDQPPNPYDQPDNADWD